jgi:adenine-specific DNA-methyltransferase
MHTSNIICENILKIKELFPNCIKEFKDSNGGLKFGVDFEMLKQELSDEIIEGDEKYEFN